MKVSLASVFISKEASKNVMSALKEGQIGGGRFIKEFEDRFAKYIGTKYAVFVANGTLADALAVAAVTEEKKEVIVPALTFVAQPNAVFHAGAKPVFVDVDDRAQIDPKEIEKAITDQTAAIFVTHLLGRVADMTEILAIGNKYEIPVLEDCCEALGAQWLDGRVGSLGKIGTFSFYASHHLATGEGGMLTTDDKEIYERLVSLRNHGRKSDKPEDIFLFSRKGFNAKGTNLSAAIGCALLDSLEGWIEKRRDNVNELGGWWEPELPEEYISPHCFVSFSNERDKKLKELLDAGIEARRLMACIPNKEQCPAYQEYEGIFPKAEFLGSMGFFVPCHQFLTNEQLEYLKIYL